MSIKKHPVYKATAVTQNDDGSHHVEAERPDGQKLSFDLSYGAWPPPDAIDVMRAVAREEIRATRVCVNKELSRLFLVPRVDDGRA